MSLSKQFYIGLIAVLTIVFIGILWVNIVNTSQFINKQLQSHAQDTATSLGLSIKPFIGSKEDLPMIDGMINAIFDSGYYQTVTLKDNTGTIILAKHNPMIFDDVPSWFVDIFPLHPPMASTEIFDGWVKPKTLHIISNPGFAYVQLWQSAIKSSLFIAMMFIITATLLSLLLKTITDPIKKAAEQASEICEGNFVQVDDIPKPIELNLFVNAMNRMSSILENMFKDLSSQTQKYQKFAYTDELTGLNNRRAFTNYFESALANHEYEQTGYCFIIRLSNLDQINKSLGYIAGDDYVKSAAVILNKFVHTEIDQEAYRLGGADLALVLPSATKVECTKIANNLIAEFELARTQQHNARFAHIGVAQYSNDNSLNQILASADTALIKSQSTDQGWYLAEHSSGVHGNNNWKVELEKILTSDKLTLVGQTIQSHEQQLLYQEIYARFTQDETDEKVNMAQLMATAERLNMTTQVDKLIIEAAFDYLSKTPSNIAINLGTASVASLEFRTWLISKLDNYKPSLNQLTFEVSEKALSYQYESLIAFVKELKRSGCKVTLEHFGATASSFSHLMELKPDYVKIDGAFSLKIGDSDENQLFVQSLVNIAHSLNIKVISELIESEAQVTKLKAMSVDYFQGYYISKPEPL